MYDSTNLGPIIIIISIQTLSVERPQQEQQKQQLTYTYLSLVQHFILNVRFLDVNCGARMT